MRNLLISIPVALLLGSVSGCQLLDSPECKMAREQLAEANFKGGDKQWNAAPLLEPEANVKRWCKF